MLASAVRPAVATRSSHRPARVLPSHFEGDISREICVFSGNGTADPSRAGRDCVATGAAALRLTFFPTRSVDLRPRLTSFRRSAGWFDQVLIVLSHLQIEFVVATQSLKPTRDDNSQGVGSQQSHPDSTVEDDQLITASRLAAVGEARHCRLSRTPISRRRRAARFLGRELVLEAAS
jgi:hypothetical protein